MGFKKIRSLIWFATTSFYFQVDVELEKKDSFIAVYTVWLEIKMWYKSWTSEVATIVAILIYLWVNRPDSLPPLPSEGVWWNVVGFWLPKAKWASWAWGHYFRYLVYIGPGIRYLNLLVSLALTWDQALFIFFFFLFLFLYFFASLPLCFFGSRGKTWET